MSVAAFFAGTVLVVAAVFDGAAVLVSLVPAFAAAPFAGAALAFGADFDAAFAALVPLSALPFAALVLSLPFFSRVAV